MSAQQLEHSPFHHHRKTKKGCTGQQWRPHAVVKSRNQIFGPHTHTDNTQHTIINPLSVSVVAVSSLLYEEQNAQQRVLGTARRAEGSRGHQLAASSRPSPSPVVLPVSSFLKSSSV
eukprot:scaffold3535_cov162-Ochromonas_danica.AAC.7